MSKSKTVYSDPLNTLNGISIHSCTMDGKQYFVLSKDGKYIQEYNKDMKRNVITRYLSQREAETAAIHHEEA